MRVMVSVPRELLQRVDEALQRALDDRAPRRIPVDMADADILQCEVRKLLAAAPSAQNARWDIGALVDRFLSWPLPKSFAPDCGITFTPVNHPNCWPIGTNLLTAEEAREMLEHVLAAAPSAQNADKEKSMDAEIYRMQLAAISTIALCNTRESLARNRLTSDSPYWTPAFEDVCKTVEREMAERERAGVALSAEGVTWIPVSERLPERFVPVLVACRDQMVGMGHLRFVPNALVAWDGDRWRIGMTDIAHDAEITHWMPLPNPPSLKSKEGGAG